MAHEGEVFEGKTLDAAVRNGLESLGLSRAEVMITILEEGSGGFLGIGARPYRVRVMRRPGGPPMTELEADERRRRRERSGGRGPRNGGSGPRREGRERRGPGGAGPERVEGRERRPSGGPSSGAATGRTEAGRDERRRDDRHRDERGEPRGERRDERRDDSGRGGRRDERGDEFRRGRRDERLQERRPEERRPGERRDERRPIERDEERRPIERDEERRPIERDEERPMTVGRARSESGMEGQGEDAGNEEGRRRRRRGRRGGRRRHPGTGPDFAPASGERGPGEVEAPAMEMEEDLAPTHRPESPVDAPLRDARPGRSEWEESEARQPHEEREERRPRERSTTPEGPGLAAEELVAQSKRLTEALLRAMGFEATVSATADGNHVDVTAEVAKDEDLLTGRKGEVRQALQHLLNRMLNRGESSRYHLQLEINDFWKRREEELRELAHTLAEEAVASRGEVVTEYLNAQERRIVHVTLREDSRVKTYALGTGMIKRVAIAPADFEGGPRDDDG